VKSPSSVWGRGWGEGLRFAGALSNQGFGTARALGWKGFDHESLFRRRLGKPAKALQIIITSKKRNKT